MNSNCNTYVNAFSQTGNGVDIYILDTGIRYSHQVFGGRASFGGYDRFGGQGVDDSGHGTHCAGLAAGRLTGVAWRARVYRYVPHVLYALHTLDHALRYLGCAQTLTQIRGVLIFFVSKYISGHTYSNLCS